MAKLGDLVVNIGANTKGLNKELGKVRRTMRRFGSNFKALGKDLTKSVSLPLLAIGAAAIKSAVDLETLETSFISLTGGVKQAADMMDQLHEFTAKTPFQIDAVANSARQLIASGTDISQVNNQLQFLGDIAATSGSSIDDIAAIFAKVNAKGKVELESLNQLAERGIPIFKALSDATGLLPSELGAGAVSVEEFNNILAGFAQEGGFAEGAMLRLSETAGGMFSTAMDNLKIAGVALVEDLMPVIKDIIDGVTNMAKGFTELNPGTQKFILILGGVAAAIGPLLVVIPSLVAGFQMMIPVIVSATTAVWGFVAAWAATPMGMITIAVGALAGAVMLFGDNTNRAIEKNDKFIDSLKGLDKEAQIVSINNMKRALEEEKVLLEIAKRASERQLRAGGGEVGVGAMSRRGGQFLKFGEDIEEATDRIADFEQRLLDLEAPLDKVGGTGGTGGSGSGVAGLNSELSEVPEKMEAIVPAVISLSSATKELQISTASIGSGLTEWIDPAIVKFEEFRDTVQSSMESAAVSMLSGVGQMIGAGKSFGEAILAPLGAMAIQLGELAIGYGIAISGIKKALKSLSPGAAIAAGITLVALGSGLQAAVSRASEENLPALAEGGLAFGPTTALVGDNKNAGIDPEVIAPLSKLKDMIGGGATNVYGRISGDDIVISNSRAARDRNRYV